MTQRLSLSVLLVFCLTLSSCGESESGSQSSGASAANLESSRFTKDFAKGCDVLTAEIVASTFDVSADSLKRMKIMGCIYTWKNATHMLSASILMVRAHKNTGAAITWFASATKNRSAEEVQAEVEMVKERMGKKEELNTEAGKAVTTLMLDAAGSQALVYEDVSGVGDEARSSADGSISVRVDNLTFSVAAYQGPQQPESDLSGLDVKQMIEAAKKDSQKWEAEIAPQRLRDSAKLAKAIIATL